MATPETFRPIRVLSAQKPSAARNISAAQRAKVQSAWIDLRIDYGWGGTLAVTMNRLPCFGRLPPDVYYAMGYSGHGVQMATLAGKLIAEALAGSAERFDVMARIPSPEFPGGTLLRWPGLVAGMLYHALRDRLGD